MFNNIRKDLETYKGDWSRQGFWVMLVYRLGKWRYSIKQSFIRKIFSFIYKLLYKLIQIITSVELPCEVEVGDGLRIEHFGPIIVNGYSKIGKNCILRHGVTIGIKSVDNIEAPTIGDNVDIGCGAVILGGIRIGNNVKIGANSVVLNDVPDNAIAVGIPAKVKVKT